MKLIYLPPRISRCLTTWGLFLYSQFRRWQNSRMRSRHRLWIHETCRQFRDRLVNKEAR